ncbi:hypothetical protein BDV96DRAFT_287959 [Lophiotrema nucula]|uniref:Uncharacterized protein n=1 Tax=Lophiotrema nucula TaxID=690887 RepID=A0A6A5YL32_9PLEO|nr:hypothetical protein BDV96DRAFT_287959 [Lophiotrema nucula]
MSRIREYFASSSKKAHSSDALALHDPGPYEDCLGEWLSSIGSHNCWELKGTAREHFAKIAQAIENHLDGTQEILPKGVLWSGFMIGRTRRTARPTIVFSSVDPTSRKTVRDAIRKSGLLDEFPGFRTAEAHRPPDFDHLVPFTDTGREQFPWNREDDDFVTILRGAEPVLEGLDGLAAIYLHSLRASSDLQTPLVHSPRSQSLALRDVPSQRESPEARVLQIPTVQISFRRHNQTGRLMIDYHVDSTTSRSATISAAIEIRGRKYLFTVAHIFSNFSLIEDEDEPDPRVEEFDVDDDSDDEDEGHDEEFVSGTSVGSLSSQSSAGSGYERDMSHRPPSGNMNTNIEQWSDVTILADIEVIIPKTSTLDYCLVAVPDEHFPLPPVLLDSNYIHGWHYLRRSAFGSATVHCAWGDSTAASLRDTPAYITVKGLSISQELWTVRNVDFGDGRLSKGDCGAWVTYSGTEELCGHLVAGSPNNGTAYLIPAHLVFADILHRFGAPGSPITQAEKPPPYRRSLIPQSSSSNSKPHFQPKGSLTRSSSVSATDGSSSETEDVQQGMLRGLGDWTDEGAQLRFVERSKLRKKRRTQQRKQKKPVVDLQRKAGSENEPSWAELATNRHWNNQTGREDESTIVADDTSIASYGPKTRLFQTAKDVMPERSVVEDTLTTSYDVETGLSKLAQEMKPDFETERIHSAPGNHNSFPATARSNSHDEEHSKTLKSSGIIVLSVLTCLQAVTVQATVWSVKCVADDVEGHMYNARLFLTFVPVLGSFLTIVTWLAFRRDLIEALVAGLLSGLMYGTVPRTWLDIRR